MGAPGEVGGGDRQRRAVRISLGLERIRKDRTTFFALVAAAPDRATLEAWVSTRFRVESDVAQAALDQTIRSMIRQ